MYVCCNVVAYTYNPCSHEDLHDACIQDAYTMILDPDTCLYDAGMNDAYIHGP